jgi:hypothetical protein
MRPKKLSNKEEIKDNRSPKNGTASPMMKPRTHIITINPAHRDHPCQVLLYDEIGKTICLRDRQKRAEDFFYLYLWGEFLKMRLNKYFAVMLA